MRNKIIIGLIVFVSLLIGFVYLQSTPQYSLYKAYEAARQQDYPTFTKYVDVDSVAEHAVDTTLAEIDMEIEERMRKNPWGRYAWRMGRVAVDSIELRMNELVKTWIKDEVTSGNMMKTTFKDVNLFVIVTQTKVEREGNVADIKVTIKNKPVVFKMRQMGDYWQVYQMDIDPSLLRSLMM